MQKLKLIFILLFFSLLTFPAFAGNTAIQTVKVIVSPILEIAVFGSPEIVISPSEKEAVGEGEYSITTNKNCKITAHVMSSENFSLFVSMQHPKEDFYSSEVLLSAQDVIVADNIHPGAAQNRKIKYRAVRNGPEAYQGSVDVIYTITD